MPTCSRRKGCWCSAGQAVSGRSPYNLGHLLGADVTATVRSDVAELVRQRGATRVIDTRTQAFDETQDRYDVVIDTVGGDALGRAFSVLRRGGRLITLSAPPPDGMAEEFGVQATFFIVTPDRDQLVRLAGLVDSGQLDVTIADIFPLEQGREAFESGRAAIRRAGKTVLAVRDWPRGSAMYDLEEAVTERRSSRLFLRDKPVPPALVDEALTSRCAPRRTRNVQPWHLILASGPARDRLVEALLEEAHAASPKVPVLPEAFAHMRRDLGAPGLRVDGDCPPRRRGATNRRPAQLEFFRAPLAGVVCMHRSIWTMSTAWASACSCRRCCWR